MGNKPPKLNYPLLSTLNPLEGFVSGVRLGILLLSTIT